MRRRWLGTMLLAPLMLGGCAAGGPTTAQPTPSGTPWQLMAQGNAAPSATPTVFSRTPSPFPTGYLPLKSATPTPTPTPIGGCAPVGGASVINHATVVPGATSAAVTWYNPGGTELVQYRITAISQDLQTGAQRDVGWTVVTPGPACAFMTATVVGLDRQTHYAFSVDEVTTRHERDGTAASTVARSAVVRTT